jgi:hypothetical protein
MKEVTYVEGGLWVQRQTERLGYQTTHINWEHLRGEKKEEDEEDEKEDEI